MLSNYVLYFEIAADKTTPSLPTDIFGELLPSYRSPFIHRIRRKAKQGKIFEIDKYGFLANRRFGSLTVEWFDFDGDIQREQAPQMEDHGRGLDPNNHESKSGIANLEDAASRRLPLHARFVPYRMGTTQLNAGVLHLYRTVWKKPSVSKDSAGTSEESTNYTRENVKEAKGSGRILCILAVPSYMAAQDFLTFVGPFENKISHIRIIRDSIPSRYLSLMKFRDVESASSFYKQYSGKRFTGMDSEVCHVVYIKDVQIESRLIPALDFHGEDTTFRSSSSDDTHTATLLEDSDKAKTAESSSTSNQVGPSHDDDEALVELPICPVCLDRMDSSTTGLLTILCQHTFHSNCLRKWQDGSCPVCRYCQKESKLENSFQNECSDCGSRENLWICLICGNVGCGRYKAAHAASHYAATQHNFSLEIETQRVWDYAGDGYVHRLIQNKEDGKLVELPAPNTESAVTMQMFTGASDKGDYVDIEYSNLLVSQLESQRLWYEAKIAELENTYLLRLSEATESLEQKTAPSREAAAASSSSSDYATDLRNVQIQLANVLKSKKQFEKRLGRAEENYSQLKAMLEEERHISESLRKNQESLKLALAEKEKELMEKERALQETSEQLRDVMFYLETQQRVNESPMKDELQQGSILIEETPKPSKGKKKR
ncbi:hypothetical protein HDU96_007644 [Phlyctochytrium bullatum]|nr:hypothetical protein HDU96_007644 [Phlyctochytrium bullatum]